MSGKIHLGLRKLTTDFATSDWKALIAGKEKRIKLLSRVELLVVLAVQEEKSFYGKKLPCQILLTHSHQNAKLSVKGEAFQRKHKELTLLQNHAKMSHHKILEN